MLACLLPPDVFRVLSAFSLLKGDNANDSDNDNDNNNDSDNENEDEIHPSLGTSRNKSFWVLVRSVLPSTAMGSAVEQPVLPRSHPTLRILVRGKLNINCSDLDVEIRWPHKHTWLDQNIPRC